MGRLFDLEAADPASRQPDDFMVPLPMRAARNNVLWMSSWILTRGAPATVLCAGCDLWDSRRLWSLWGMINFQLSGLHTALDLLRLDLGLCRHAPKLKERRAVS
jgi:hypothetical protein